MDVEAGLKAQMEHQPKLIQVADGVYAWIGAAGDSNAGAFVTREGLVAIDAQQYPRLAQQFRAGLTAETGLPVVRLIDTHCHLDHTAGNIVFADVPILAHEKTVQAMHAALGPLGGANWTVSDYATKIRFMFGMNLFDLVPESDPAQAWFRQRIGTADYDDMAIAPPTETFADSYSFRTARDEVRLHYWGPAHCDGDIVVHEVKSGVIFLGDLLFYRRFPWLGDCDLDGWIDRLARVLTLDVKVVIPGHGPPTDLAEVARFRTMLVDLRDAVGKAIRSGVSEEAAMREVHLPQYASIPRYADWMPLDVKATYRYLKTR